MKKGIIALFTGLIALTSTVNAQQIDGNSYNYNSVYPIRLADIHFQTTLWYRMDLREKLNEPFFTENNQITKVIINAVNQGVLRPYKNDSLNTRMRLDEFKTAMKRGGDDAGGGDDWGGGGDSWGGGGGDSWGGGGGDSWGGGGGDSWGDGGGGGAAPAVSNEYFPQDIYILEIKEDLIFDRKRSRMYRDIQSITLILPGEVNPAGFDKPIATFRYKELVNAVFVDNPEAVWYNAANSGEKRNLAEAFDLRLFDGYIYKFMNSRDEAIVDIYGNNKTALAESQNYRHQLLDYESNLWSN